MEPLQHAGKSDNLVKEIIVLKLINSYRLFTHDTGCDFIMSNSTTAITAEISHKKLTSAVNYSPLFFLHFYRTVYNCKPPASKQVLQILKIILNK